MNPKTLFEFYKRTTTQNIDELIQDYSNLIDIIVKMRLSLFRSKVQVPQYWTKVEILIKKYVLASRTTISLIETNKTNALSNSQNTVDVTSIHIICRSLFENFLTIFYLFSEKKENEEIIKCRNLIYEISGLGKRQILPATTEFAMKQKENEAAIIISLKDALLNNQEFQNLNLRFKKKVLEGPVQLIPAKIFSWKKLFEISALDNNFFLNSWGIYSNYAHSEYYSIMQLKGLMAENDKLNLFTTNAVKSQIMLTSHLITELCGLFDCMNEVFDEEKESIRDAIILWNKIATGNLEKE